MAHEEEGAVMPEYRLMVAMVALVAMIGIEVFGQGVTTLFDNPQLLTSLSP